MPESHFLALPLEYRREALLHAEALSRVPADLLEKDVWVVSVLGSLFGPAYAESLSFKGGTSLSKVYGVLDRFSEDIDVTCDIRTFVEDADLPDGTSEVQPASRSQARKWSRLVRAKLPGWVQGVVMPDVSTYLEGCGVTASVSADNDSLRVAYDSAVSVEIGYVKPVVLVEFGARSTGEPTGRARVSCSAAPHLPDLTFPVADVRAMAAERTFWEKATAVHAFSSGGAFRAERFSRHWYDLVMLDRSGVAASAVALTELAETVARHKKHFFPVRGQDGREVDYMAAVRGHLRLVPDGGRLTELAVDYDRMMAVGMLSADAPTFGEVIDACSVLEDEMNGRALGRAR